MTESRARQKLKAIQRRAKKGLCESPTLFHVARDGDKIMGVEVRGDDGLLWAWPRGFRSRLKNDSGQVNWGKWRWDLLDIESLRSRPMGLFL